jgi:hypothetical protein
VGSGIPDSEGCGSGGGDHLGDWLELVAPPDTADVPPEMVAHVFFI